MWIAAELVEGDGVQAIHGVQKVALMLLGHKAQVWLQRRADVAARRCDGERWAVVALQVAEVQVPSGPGAAAHRSHCTLHVCKAAIQLIITAQAVVSVCHRTPLCAPNTQSNGVSKQGENKCCCARLAADRVHVSVERARLTKGWASSSAARKRGGRSCCAGEVAQSMPLTFL